MVVKTSSFEGLLQVARRLECPILHHHPDDSYAVVDNGTLYHYVHGAGVQSSSTVASSGNGHSPKVASRRSLGDRLRRGDVMSPRRRWRHGAAAWAGAGVLLASVVCGLGMGSIVMWALPAAAQSSCDTSTPVVLSYGTVTGGSGGHGVRPTPVGILRRLRRRHCGSAHLYGNSAGDPSVAKASDQLLSTADSTLDPCTGAALSSPGVVAGGAIDLPLCSSGAAADVSVHDLTLVGVSVNGRPVPVALAAVGTKSSRRGQPSGDQRLGDEIGRPGFHRR